MIKKIHIRGFKCFKDKVSFPLSKINLLTGINGRGKSTFLQTLLLFRQSIEKNRNTKKLYLKGNSIELGNYKDIKNSETPANSNIIIGFEQTKEPISEMFFELTDNTTELSNSELNYKDDFIANINSINYKTSDKEDGELSWHDNYFNEKGISRNADLYLFYKTLERIHYVSADRLGPLKYHDKESLNENFINVGAKGEFCINVLAKLQDKQINTKLYLGNDAQTLIQQTEEWLNFIFEGAKITIKGSEKDSDSSVLNILFNTSKTKERYKPINVGFGYSYILPIIVSGLIAKKNEILIVENPEAHLHPKAQSRITEFLAKVASTGVQVFIESHSEHILNGLIISTLRDDIILDTKDTSLLYFQNKNEIPFVKLNLQANGEIDNWVDGFFDQQEIDLAQIFKLGRKK